MKIIKTPNFELGSLSAQLIKLYEWLENGHLSEEPLFLHEGLKDFIGLIPSVERKKEFESSLKKRVLEKKSDLEFVLKNLETFSLVKSESNSLRFGDYPVVNVKRRTSVAEKAAVAFSGGKDSARVSLLLKEKGYDVDLFFLDGVNRSYYLEKSCAKKVSDLLNMRLITQSISNGGSGKHFYKESPIKNQVILAMMLDHEYLQETATYATGVTISTTSDASLIDPNCGWTDWDKMMNSFEDFIKKFFLPEFNLVNLTTELESILFLAEKRPDVLSSCVSCMMPHRWQKVAKLANEKKFSVKIWDNRCMSCEKCRWEYVVLYERNFYSKEESSEDLYLSCRNYIIKNPISCLNVPYVD